MKLCAAGIAFFFMFSAAVASAQTNVTNNNDGATNTVPVYTGGATLGNSPISVSGGNVGIGTTSPTFTVDVNGSIRSAVSNANGLYVNGNSSSYSGSDIQIIRNSSEPGVGQSPTLQFTDQATGYDSIIQSYQGQLQFWQAVGNGWTQNMTISGTGAVGIGTTNPTEPLEVNGNTKVDGTMTVSGTGGLDVQSGGITFPDGTVQTTAYPASSSGESTPIQVVNNATENENEAEFNGGVSANGSGMKHISSNASCQIYQYSWNYCSVIITWPGTPFTDTNYDVVCTPKTGAYGANSDTPQAIFLYVPDTGKTTTSVTVTIQVGKTSNGGGLVTLAPGLSCIAIHD